MKSSWKFLTRQFSNEDTTAEMRKEETAKKQNGIQ